MSRVDSMARLALAYARHQLARRVPGRLQQHPVDQLDRLFDLYAPDHLLTFTPEERDRLPACSRCINCGLCALVAGRLGRVHLPDLASSYLRPLPLLAEVAGDLEGGEPDLAAAAAACPVGVPLAEVASMVRRFAQASPERP